MATIDYQEVREETGIHKQIPPGVSNEPRSDGFSFYRAVARHILGDPNLYKSIFEAVLTHYLLVIADDRNPYHDQYSKFDKLDVQYTETFVGGLSSPDLCLGPQNSVHTASSILEVITNALDIKLVLHRNDMTLWLQDGPVNFPEYHVKFLLNVHTKNEYCCSVLTPANDGRVLIEYLEQHRNDVLPIGKIIWWREPDETGAYHCYNEYNPRTRLPDLSNNPDSLSVFTVFIKKSTEILPALTLMDEALKRAPGQEIPLSYRDNSSSLKRYVSADAEFKEIALNESIIRDRYKSATPKELEMMLNGAKEPLCSVLTIAVDRQLVFSFYLLDMLQNPDADTVSSSSIQETDFEQRVSENMVQFQNDISVLDATIAHMYQGTLRNDYMKKKWGTGESNWIRPTWKVDSGQWFNEERPKDLVFPRRALCDLHDCLPTDSNQTNFDEENHCCPCTRTGNVDITTIVDYLCIQFKYIDPSSRKPLLKRTWVSARQFCNYERFVTWTMGADRLFPLLNYFKSIPDKFGHRGDPRRDAFYQSIGPGMERDDDLMGYNIGDVAGVALLMRFLTTTDDRMLFLAGLANYSYDVGGPVSDRAIHQYPHKITAFEPSPSPQPYIYLDDYAKSWKREQVGEERLKYGELTRIVRVADVFQGEPSFEARMMPYFEHEARARVGRECFEAAKQVSSILGLSYEEVRDISRKASHRRRFDPLDFTLPKWFSNERMKPSRHCKGRISVTRTATTPYEDYLALRRERSFSSTEGFPRGFAAGTKSSGRPMLLTGSKFVDSHLRLAKNARFPVQRAPVTPQIPSNTEPLDENDFKSEALLPAEQRIKSQEARREADEYGHQKLLNEGEGRMAEIRLDDIYDPYGRHYRRAWNQAVDDGLNYEEKVAGDFPVNLDDVMNSPGGTLIGGAEEDARTQMMHLQPTNKLDDSTSQKAESLVNDDGSDTSMYDATDQEVDFEASNHSGETYDGFEAGVNDDGVLLTNGYDQQQKYSQEQVSIQREYSKYDWDRWDDTDNSVAGVNW